MSFASDLRYAVRTLRRWPGFAAAAIATLGLGIGAATAIYSVVHGVLLRPLDYQQSERIVTVNTRFVSEAREHPRLTGGDLPDVRNETALFESFTALSGGEVGVQVNGRAEFAGFYTVNAGFFDVLKTGPVAGRAFGNSEAEQSAVVGAAFARRNFGGVEQAVGQKLRVEERVYEIAGVMPDGFEYPRLAAIWAAARYEPERKSRSAYNYRAIARLREGVSIEQANAKLDALGASLAAAFPADNRDKRFTVTRLQDQVVRPIRGTLYFLLGAVGLLLLIACANVANLLLARSAGRTREIAVRSAVGASRGRIARQLFAECLVLACAGGVLGVVIASWGTSLLIDFAPENLPRLGEVRMSLPILLFAAAVSLATSLLFGLLPAFTASRADVVEALKRGSRGVAGGPSPRLRNAIVAGEVALSFCLALGAGLLFRNLIQLVTADLGFRTEGTLVMYAHYPARNLKQLREATRFFDELYPDLAGLPGVQSAAGAMGLPAGKYGSNGSYAVEGRHKFESGEKLPHAGFRLASPGYFQTIGMRLIAGRDFTFADQFDAPFVAIVSESLARATFPNENPLGKRIKTGLDESDKWMTVVGVASDVRQDSPASKPEPELYMPLSQHPWHANEVQVVIRTRVEPETLTGAARALVAARNPDVATHFTTMRKAVSDSIATPRFQAYLTGAFALCALLLAMAGVFGVMSYLAARRTAEFGIRLSLGATAQSIAVLVISNAARIAAAGLAAGAGLAFAGLRVTRSLVADLGTIDLSTAAITVAALALAVILAAALPALRAARTNPIEALRIE